MHRLIGPNYATDRLPNFQRVYLDEKASEDSRQRIAETLLALSYATLVTILMSQLLLMWNSDSLPWNYWLFLNISCANFASSTVDSRFEGYLLWSYSSFEYSSREGRGAIFFFSIS